MARNREKMIEKEIEEEEVEDDEVEDDEVEEEEAQIKGIPKKTSIKNHLNMTSKKNTTNKDTNFVY